MSSLTEGELFCFFGPDVRSIQLKDKSLAGFRKRHSARKSEGLGSTPILRQQIVKDLP